MGKLIESTFVTLDGEISEPHVWGQPYWDEEHDKYVGKLVEAADALLLGRVTYESFAEAWPPQGDIKMNRMTKYVTSRTLAETTWNAQVLQGDVAEEVARLKESGTNLLKYGTGELDCTLIEHGLVDEFHFWYNPVIAGSGRYLFQGAGVETTHLSLVDVHRFGSGIVVLVFAPK